VSVSLGHIAAVNAIETIMPPGTVIERYAPRVPGSGQQRGGQISEGLHRQAGQLAAAAPRSRTQ